MLSKAKTDCFGYGKDGECSALDASTCAGCKFYRPFDYKRRKKNKAKIEEARQRVKHAAERVEGKTK